MSAPSGFSAQPSPSEFLKEVPAPFDQEVIAPLLHIQKNVLTLEQQVETKRERLATSPGQPRLLEELNAVEAKLKKARANFINTATGMELVSVEFQSTRQKRDLYQELLQFIEPLFDGLRRVTEKPRRVEAYKTKIAQGEEEFARYQQGLERLSLLRRDCHSLELKNALKQAESALVFEQDELRERLDTWNRKLRTDLQDQRSIFQEVRGMVTAFVVDEGTNLLIVILVCALILVGSFGIRPWVVQLLGDRVKKTVEPLYSVMTVVVAALAVLLALYIRNDWFLISVIALLLVGFAWTSKALLRVFVNEVKLILNLGPVREGERVMWDGLPWRVQRLGFQSLLINPRFPGVEIRLPASVLVTLHSRVIVPHEAWFPTQTGDYVLMDDGVYGRVEVQSPDQVILATASSRKYYTVTGFLQKNPMNCSEGFELVAEVTVHDPSLYIRRIASHRADHQLKQQVNRLLMLWVPNAHLAQGSLPTYQLSIRASSAPGPALESIVKIVVQCSGEWAGVRARLLVELPNILTEAYTLAQKSVGF